MKAYILTEDDLERLILRIDRNPQHGYGGGSSRGIPTREQSHAEIEAHEFYNYQVRQWIDEVKK